MALIMREGNNNFGDINISDQILFDNWELEENAATNAFEINNNGVNAISIADGTQLVTFTTGVTGLKINDSGTDGTLQICNSGTGTTSGDGTIIGLTSSTFFINNQEATNINLQQNGTTYLAIKSDGLIGIGSGNTSPLIDLAIGDSDTGLNQEGDGELAIYTNNLERVRFDNSGFIGMGQTNPLAPLHIASTTNNIIRCEITDAGSGYISFSNTDSVTTADIRFGIDANENLEINNLQSNNICFLTENVEKMTIDSDGNVGIGLSSPQRRLHIHESTDCFLQITNDTTGSTSGEGSIIGFSGSSSILQIRQRENAEMNFYTNDVITMTLDASGQLALGGTFNPSITFAIGDADTGIDWVSDGEIRIMNNNTETIRFNSNNDIGVNLTSNPDARLHIYEPTGEVCRIESDNITLAADLLVCQAKTTIRCYIRGDGDLENINGTYGTISDAKYKENIIDANSQWEDIKAIKFRKFNFIEDIDETKTQQLGVVAQELELVSGGLVKNNVKKVKTGNKIIVKKIRKKKIIEINEETKEEEEKEIDEEYEEEEDEEIDEEYKSVKSSIIFMKGMVALQECMIRIEALEEEVDKLKKKE